MSPSLTVSLSISKYRPRSLGDSPVLAAAWLAGLMTWYSLSDDMGDWTLDRELVTVPVSVLLRLGNGGPG